MLWTEVEDELLGLEALLGFDDRKVDERAFLDLTDLRLGAQLNRLC
jgi:hypothetical protein